ncbi:MAG: trypsin-like peptidase domain-containing protein [Microcoleaceae cyanobacterium]
MSQPLIHPDLTSLSSNLITLNATELNTIASDITVRIDGPRGGSGVIVEGTGNIYYVLTNWHVVNRVGEYEIITADGQRHSVYYSLIRQIDDIDLAIIPFESSQRYPIATIADSSAVEIGSPVHVGGWPRSGSTLGQRLFLSTEGKLTRRQSPRNGYTLVYTNLVRSGMSGGPILNEAGNLIGINGLVQLGINRNQIVSAGIEINRFLNWRKTATLPTIPTLPTANSEAESNTVTTSLPAPTPTQNKTPTPGDFLLAKSLRDESGEIMALQVISDYVLSGNSNGSIGLWSLETGGLRRAFSAHSGGVNALDISKEGNILVTGGEDGTVKLWNFASGLDSGEFSLLHTLKGHDNAVLSVAITPDGQTVISGSWDSTVKIWDVKTGELLQTLSGHSQMVSALAISPDGRILASGSKDSTVKLWNLETGELIQTLKGHSLAVLSIAMSSDGAVLATGSADGTIGLWQLNTGQPIRRFQSHTDGVWSVDISENSNTLVSGSWDKTVKLWDINTGELNSTLTGHPSYVNAVTISADGNTIVSGGWDAQVKIWQKP